LTALASLVLYPNLVDKESGYVRTADGSERVPPALRGVMLAAFAARTCRPSARSSIGAPLTSSTTSIAGSCGAAARSASNVIVSQAVTVGLMLVSIYVTAASWRQSSRRGSC